MAEVQISGKNLGAAALPDFCPRCYWLKLRVKMPYQIFPGIFSSIDAYTKKAVEARIGRGGGSVPWLPGIARVARALPTPHWSRFRHVDPATGILLTGAPDALFETERGGLVIADYKTAKYTENQDALLPMYEVQLNAYAMIARALGYPEVESLALLYMQPVTTQEAADEAANDFDGGFRMAFEAHVHPIGFDEERVHRLLRLTKDLAERPEPPARAGECGECAKVDALAEAAGFVRGLPVQDRPGPPARPPSGEKAKRR